jgi:hypothetical protein
LSDDFSARTASELCGKEFPEDFRFKHPIPLEVVSFGSADGGAVRGAAPGKYAEAYDGVNPLPASYCYLKPYYLDPNKSYFEQFEDGEI